MRPIETIYLITTTASVFTSFPQIRQIYKMKNSDEFSLFSWIAWFISQVAALIYSISIHSIPYLIVNIMWIAFYITMISLILKYLHNAVLTLAHESIQ
ncbi:MAG: hypothetical protein NVSMB46_00040 [Candidatus Saccharimonadales bacterium]